MSAKSQVWSPGFSRHSATARFMAAMCVPFLAARALHAPECQRTSSPLPSPPEEDREPRRAHLPNCNRRRFAAQASERASTLVIVLWIAFGLVSLALYFSHT